MRTFGADGKASPQRSFLSTKCLGPARSLRTQETFEALQRYQWNTHSSTTGTCPSVRPPPFPNITLSADPSCQAHALLTSPNSPQSPTPSISTRNSSSLPHQTPTRSGEHIPSHSNRPSGPLHPKSPFPATKSLDRAPSHPTHLLRERVLSPDLVSPLARVMFILRSAEISIKRSRLVQAGHNPVCASAASPQNL